MPTWGKPVGDGAMRVRTFDMGLSNNKFENLSAIITDFRFIMIFYKSKQKYLELKHMSMTTLLMEVKSIIEDIKDNGIFKKENDFVDYKRELAKHSEKNEIEIFFKNFAKDILAFANNRGGVILLGFEENKITGKINEIGLNEEDIKILSKIDLNKINQKIDSITRVGIGIEIQEFRIATKLFYYIIIEKSSQTLIAVREFTDYKLKQGEIYHRISGKNELANENTSKLNHFLQIKANEKSKEFMAIWSKLLPEIFDINPKEILMINPNDNRIYGYNEKDRRLDSSKIDINKDETGVFKVILQAISAGEIGKISDTEGKPIYKIVGELKTLEPKDYIYASSLTQKVREQTNFKISTEHIKQAIHYLGWTTIPKFDINKPKDDLISKKFSEFIWLSKGDAIKGNKKVVFSEKAVEPLVELIKQPNKHGEVFGRELSPIQNEP